MVKPAPGAPWNLGLEASRGNGSAYPGASWPDQDSGVNLAAMTRVKTGPIAFFLPTLAGGGAERVILNLADGISERGLSVDLVVASAEGPLLAQLRPAVRLLDLRAPRVIRSVVPLTSYLRRERPRVLVSSMSHANLVALWAARLARRSTPVMVTVHNTMSRSTVQQGRLAEKVWPHLLRTFYPWS